MCAFCFQGFVKPAWKKKKTFLAYFDVSAVLKKD
jgi:hypothetical protein